eukprot:403371336
MTSIRVFNKRAIMTTFCCSGNTCSHPSICLHGQKIYNDFCDYNFECLSRCCHGSRCSHFLECYETCSVNSDCKMTGCCTEGFCSSSVVWECQVSPVTFPDWVWALITLVIIGGFFALIYAFCLMKRNFRRQKEDIYSALAHIAEMHDNHGNSHNKPLLGINETHHDLSHSLILQNTSRKFLYNNPRKIPHIPLDMKFHATPIQEALSEYQFNTYEDKYAGGGYRQNSFGSQSQINLGFGLDKSNNSIQRKNTDEDDNKSTNSITKKWLDSMRKSALSSKSNNLNIQARQNQIQMGLPVHYNQLNSPLLKNKLTNKPFLIEKYQSDQSLNYQYYEPPCFGGNVNIQNNQQQTSTNNVKLQEQERILQNNQEKKHVKQNKNMNFSIIDVQKSNAQNQDSSSSSDSNNENPSKSPKNSLKTTRLPKKRGYAEDDFFNLPHLMPQDRDFKLYKQQNNNQNQLKHQHFKDSSDLLMVDKANLQTQKTVLIKPNKNNQLIFLDDQIDKQGGELSDEDGYHESSEDENIDQFDAKDL